MCRSPGIALLALPIWMAMARLANAGMPSVTLSDVASLRLQVISFFLMGLLASAGVVCWIWNSLAKEFTQLPRLSFLKACGVVILWGLLFVVVLTMISGARELMTPGAWEKVGATYKLRSETVTASAIADPHADSLLVRRREHLQRLGSALALHAARHGSKFPASQSELAEDAALWHVPQVRDQQYQYVSGLSASGTSRPLVYEPACFDGDVLVLFTDMHVRAMGVDELRQLLQSEGS
ncbi:MAG TPA: hypothetical protein VMP01_09275 [Pirellulaceae bacterium]|nr:hypothetical protein [Pirellulaceae bacterium]